jgi:hypothetical protein
MFAEWLEEFFPASVDQSCKIEFSLTLNLLVSSWIAPGWEKQLDMSPVSLSIADRVLTDRSRILPSRSGTTITASFLFLTSRHTRCSPMSLDFAASALSTYKAINFVRISYS